MSLIEKNMSVFMVVCVVKLCYNKPELPGLCLLWQKNVSAIVNTAKALIAVVFFLLGGTALNKTIEKITNNNVGGTENHGKGIIKGP